MENELTPQELALLKSTTTIHSRLKNDTLPKFLKEYENLFHKKHTLIINQQKIKIYPLDIFLNTGLRYTDSYYSSSTTRLLNILIPFIDKNKLKFQHTETFQSLLAQNIKPELFFRFITTIEKYNDFSNSYPLAQWYKNHINHKNPNTFYPEIFEYLQKLDLKGKLKNNQ